MGELNKLQQLKDKILHEAARTHKAADNAKDQGYYMSWQTLDTREKTLLEVISLIDETIKGGTPNE